MGSHKEVSIEEKIQSVQESNDLTNDAKNKFLIYFNDDIFEYLTNDDAELIATIDDGQGNTDKHADLFNTNKQLYELSKFKNICREERQKEYWWLTDNETIFLPMLNLISNNKKYSGHKIVNMFIEFIPCRDYYYLRRKEFIVHIINRLHKDNKIKNLKKFIDSLNNNNEYSPKKWNLDNPTDDEKLLKQMILTKKPDIALITEKKKEYYLSLFEVKYKMRVNNQQLNDTKKIENWLTKIFYWADHDLKVICGHPYFIQLNQDGTAVFEAVLD